MKVPLYFLFSLILLSCAEATSRATNDLAELPIDKKPKLDSFAYEFPWLDSYDIENTLVNRVALPEGFERIKAEKGSFTHWLQHLPLKEGKPDVYLYDGSSKWNQSAHEFVLDIDVGKRDLQQCADAAMRLRAEYLYNNGKKDLIHFNYTNGAEVRYEKWRQGYMPIPKGSKVNWVQSSKAGEGYDKFKKYMIQIFNYAGTYSLSKELKSIPFLSMQPGDLLVKGGSPGHAVIIMDMCIHPTTGEKLFMLAQSYMPAQDIQILKNENNSTLSPWYSMDDIDHDILTPEWGFDTSQLMRWN